MESQKEKSKKQKFKLKNKSILRITTFDFLLVFLTFNFLFLTSNTTSASSVSSENFQLDIQEIDPAYEPPQRTPTPTPQPEQHGNLGVLTTPSSFSFAISESVIDFGVLSATNPVTRTTTLRVVSPGSGYQVFALADHVLLSKKNVSIPDTTCDNGSCSENTQALWENNLTYGFGFRCEDITRGTCTEGFERENTFKQFSDKGKNEIMQPLIESQLATKEHQAQITYKLNISGTQPKESYSNTVMYIAVPNY